MTAKPFTLPHFRWWIKDRGLTLDNGEPWKLEPFQAAFARDLLTGCKECWFILPEGNAKTTLLAGLGLYHLEHREAAGVPVAASSRDQAEIWYRQAEGFVARAELKNFRTFDGYRRITYGRGRIQIFAADSKTGDGIIPTLCIIDELHRHQDLRLYRTWRGKLNKRGGQIVAISTRGEPGSEFEITLDRLHSELTATDQAETFTRLAAPQFILHQWAVPDDGDLEDMRLVKAANPLKAITVASLSEKFATPSMTLGHWARFTCNRPTRAENSAITEAEWFGARVDEPLPSGTPIWLGLDVAWKWDTTAMVPYWQNGPENRRLGTASVLTPPRNGDALDPHLVETTILDIHARNPIHTVVMDTSRAEQLSVWITERTGALVVDRQQTNMQAVEDYDRFMEALRNGWLKHAGDAGLTSHALNAVAKVLPGGDARFDRPSQSRMGPEQERRVIDALIAAAMVHSVASVNVPPPAPVTFTSFD